MKQIKGNIMKIRLYAYPLLAYLTFYSMAATTNIPKKNFIFDFGGVLVLTDTMVSFRHIGMMNAVECSFRLGINPFYLDQHIKTTLFAILDEIEKVHNLSQANAYHQAYDEKGNELPCILCAWLQGTMTSSEIKALVEKEINLHPEWFGCHAEQRIIQNTTRLIFTPELFASSVRVSHAGIAFIKRCKREGHKIYGLSNWDAESFALLKEQHPELFDLFDGIIVSGEVKANKPHATIYQILLERYQLCAENCWFIDDQKENVEAAQKLGINAIVHNSSFVKLIQNIRITYSKSARRENLNTNGKSDTTIKSTNNAIIDGENISLTDSTKFNCLPANV